eukprot:bmy_01621T0
MAPRLCSISAAARRLLGRPGPGGRDVAAVAAARFYSKDNEGSWFRSLFVHKVDPRKDAHSTLLSKKETSNLYKIQFHNVKPECLDAYNSLTEAVLPKLHLDEDYPCSLVGNWNTWYGEQDQAVHLWRFSGGYPALMDCMNKLKNNKPGTMIEWGNNWARAIKYRQENQEAVGGFFSQIGELYVVHHLWVPLVRHMESRIMIPLKISPLQ